MTFEEENKHIQAIFNCMTNNTESPVIQEMIRGEVRNIENEARRTDPVKAKMLEALKDLLIEAKDLYQYYPNNFRQTADEYFADEIKAIKAVEGE